MEALKYRKWGLLKISPSGLDKEIEVQGNIRNLSKIIYVVLTIPFKTVHYNLYHYSAYDGKSGPR